MTITPLDPRQKLLKAFPPYGDLRGYSHMLPEEAARQFRFTTGQEPKTAYVCGNLLFLSAKEES